MAGLTTETLPVMSVGHLSSPGGEIKTYRFHSNTIGSIGGASNVVDKSIVHLTELFSNHVASAVEKLIADENPDCILVHNTQGWGSQLFRSIGRLGRPCLHILHDQGLTCLNRGSFRHGVLCRHWCLPCHVTTPVRVHAVQSIARLALVSPSQFNLSAIERRVDFGSIPRHVIPNPNQYPVHGRQARPSGDFRLLYVGRLSPEKGVEVAIEVVRSLLDRYPLSLQIVGDGPSRTSLEQRAAGLPVQFLGHVDQDTVGRHMSGADLLLLPSMWDENFPGVAVHALQSGLPVVASRAGGIPEIVNDGVEGVLLPRGDINAWTRSLADLLSQPYLLSQMSAAAVQRGKDFDAPKLVQRFEAAIKSIAGVEE